MSDTNRLGYAGLLAALVSLIAVSCGSDIVDLLPPTTGAGNGGGAGRTTTSAAGTGFGGVHNEAGSGAMSQAGVSGTVASTNSGGGTANGGCSGFGCGEGGENPGFAGSFGGPICNGMGSCTPCLSDLQCVPDQHCSRFLGNVCVQCAENGKGQCKPGYSCDRLVGRCGLSCKTTADCYDGRVCDMAQGTCVACIDNQQCAWNQEQRVCYLRRCVQCQEDADCTQGDRRHCANLQCVQCTHDKDCPGSNGSAFGHCDTAQARCQ